MLPEDLAIPLLGYSARSEAYRVSRSSRPATNPQKMLRRSGDSTADPAAKDLGLDGPTASTEVAPSHGRKNHYRKSLWRKAVPGVGYTGNNRDGDAQVSLSASYGHSIPPGYRRDDDPPGYSNASHTNGWGMEGTGMGGPEVNDPEMLQRQALLPPSPQPSHGLLPLRPVAMGPLVADNGATGRPRRRRDPVVLLEPLALSSTAAGSASPGKKKRPRSLLRRVARSFLAQIPFSSSEEKKKARRRQGAAAFRSALAGRTATSPLRGRISSGGAMPLAVAVWYGLGVLSISTTKILLTDPAGTGRGEDPDGGTTATLHGGAGGVTPLILTLQQFCVGVSMMHLLRRQRQRDRGKKGPDIAPAGADLRLASMYFTLGFLLTNVGFRSGAAPFVETVKASEPITSAGIAAYRGIERLGFAEAMCLGGIVAGVMLSTLGHSSGGGDGGNTSGGAVPPPLEAAAVNAASGPARLAMPSAVPSSGWTCAVIMLSNLCFSLRGLHQKLFRASQGGGSSVVDDVDLQYWMQRFGALSCRWL